MHCFTLESFFLIKLKIIGIKSYLRSKFKTVNTHAHIKTGSDYSDAFSTNIICFMFLFLHGIKKEKQFMFVNVQMMLYTSTSICPENIIKLMVAVFFKVLISWHSPHLFCKHMSESDKLPPIPGDLKQSPDPGHSMRSGKRC